MNTLHSLSMVLWQSADAPAPQSERHYLIFFIGVVAFSLLVNALVTMGATIATMKTLKEVKELAHDVHSKLLPIMQKTTDVVDDLAPKIRTISENATQISYTVREKVDLVGETVTQVNRTVNEANQRTRGQVDHVDRMVTEALVATEEITHTVAHGIRIPIKQVAGMIAGLRVGIDTLVKNFTPKNNRGPNEFDL
jgi:methyl-accepting chemotaxis protein